MKKIKIGIIGCGAIGSYLAKRIDKELNRETRLVAISDIRSSSVKDLLKTLHQKPAILDLNSLIKKSDLIIEATSVASCRSFLPDVLSAGKNILIMSVGALLANAGAIKKAKRSGSVIYIPSGAIAGVDAFKAAKLGKIKSVKITTRKPAASLSTSFYVQKRNINLSALKKDKVLFSGNANDAIKNFPQNINVAAVLSLATLGGRKTIVKIIASPNLERNIHEIEIYADCGKIITRTENVASIENPKTSFLAMLSAFATLKGIISPVKIGT